MNIKRFILLCLFLLSGCTTIRSTMLNRLDNDSFYASSDGDSKLFGRAKPYEGVPITIKVPTHVDVYINETYYLYASEKGLDPLKLNHRSLAVDIKTIETDKVFIVDFKRPFSGFLEYGATLGDDQYFDSIKTKLEDTTIKDVSSLVAAAIPLATKKRDAVIGPELKKNIIENKRTVAYQRFDIDAPDFEDSLRSFLDYHLNCCNSCETRMSTIDEPLMLVPPKKTKTPSFWCGDATMISNPSLFPTNGRFDTAKPAADGQKSMQLQDQNNSSFQ